MIPNPSFPESEGLFSEASEVEGEAPSAFSFSFARSPSPTTTPTQARPTHPPQPPSNHHGTPCQRQVCQCPSISRHRSHPRARAHPASLPSLLCPSVRRMIPRRTTFTTPTSSSRPCTDPALHLPLSPRYELLCPDCVHLERHRFPR